MDELDFEGTGSANGNNGGNNNGNNNNDDAQDINGGKGNDITGKDNNNNDNDGDNHDDDNHDNDNHDDNPSTGELEAGTQVEFEGVTYTVAENGDIVDKDGKVFKEAKDVKAWLEENNASDDDTDNNLSVDSIRAAIGVDVVGEDGNPIEFTNDAAGVKSYVDSVINLKSQEIQEGAINKLFADNPILKQFIDYVTVNGTAKGFGEMPDRSGWTIDKDNEAQLEAIVRMAAKEFGNKSITDTYIKYLKESGALYDEAKSQLEALVEKDKRVRAAYEQEARAKREAEQAETNAYFQKVYDTLNKGIIGEYKLPDTIVKEVNGKKITLTKKDFYKYISEASTDEEGYTATQFKRDLDNLSDEARINRDLLDAWLMFTGGSYKDLIDMAVKEDKVRKLVVKSKEQRSARTIKVQKPNSGKVNPEDIILS